MREKFWGWCVSAVYPHLGWISQLSGFFNTRSCNTFNPLNFIFLDFLEFSDGFPYHLKQDTCVRQPGGSWFLRLSFRGTHFIRAGQMWLDSWAAAKPRFIPTFPPEPEKIKPPLMDKGNVYSCLFKLG